jgi:hypothetical protein
MVAGLFLVERTTQGVSEDKNQVRQVIVHEDDAQTNAQIITAVIASLNAAIPAGDPSGSQNVYPAGYFDTVTQIGAAPAGPLATDGDFYAYPPQVAALNT